MNKLELEILRQSVRAAKTYETITGDWLFHAPEHYLQNYLFIEMGKKHWLYLEATRKKIDAGTGRPALGRPPKAKTRFDLLVWHSSSDRVRAVIEVKRSWSITDALRKDAERIRKSVSGSKEKRTGYLLAYTEAKKTTKGLNVEDKLAYWGKSLDLRTVGIKLGHTEDGEIWEFGFGLYRVG